MAQGVVCEFCSSEKVVKNGRLKRFVRDIPRGGRPTLVEFVAQNWLCRACGKSWAEYPPGVEKWVQATDALIEYIIAYKGKKMQAEIATECGLKLNTVKIIQNPDLREKRRRAKKRSKG